MWVPPGGFVKRFSEKGFNFSKPGFAPNKYTPVISDLPSIAEQASPYGKQQESDLPRYVKLSRSPQMRRKPYVDVKKLAAGRQAAFHTKPLPGKLPRTDDYVIQPGNRRVYGRESGEKHVTFIPDHVARLKNGDDDNAIICRGNEGLHNTYPGPIAQGWATQSPTPVAVDKYHHGNSERNVKHNGRRFVRHSGISPSGASVSPRRVLIGLSHLENLSQHRPVNASYPSDERHRSTPERLISRKFVGLMHPRDVPRPMIGGNNPTIKSPDISQKPPPDSDDASNRLTKLTRGSLERTRVTNAPFKTDGVPEDGSRQHQTGNDVNPDAELPVISSHEAPAESSKQ